MTGQYPEGAEILGVDGTVILADAVDVLAGLAVESSGREVGAVVLVIEGRRNRSTDRVKVEVTVPVDLAERLGASVTWGAGEVAAFLAARTEPGS